MGEILEISFFMWIVAVASFAPLGYFIYLFTKGDGESFGKSNPADHSIEEKPYYQVVDSILSTILGGSKPVAKTAVNSAPSSPSATVASASTANQKIARRTANIPDTNATQKAPRAVKPKEKKAKSSAKSSSKKKSTKSS